MKVLNFGSLNIDHVYQVDHITAPGETIAAQNLKMTLGGKGLNQSIALAMAGVNTYHAGCVGSDGGVLVEKLGDSGVHTEYVWPLDMVTGHAIIQVSHSGQNSIIIFSGANGALTPDMVEHTMDQFRTDTMVLIQNETSSVHYIAQQCINRGIPLAFNPSPFTEDLNHFPYEAVTYLLINETEGMQISGKTRPEDIADFLLERYPNMKVVLTLGGDGVYYGDKNERIYQTAFPVKPVDTTGAGDTFTGFFLGMVLKGLPTEAALRYACAAAALSVMQSGAAASIPKLTDVERFLQEWA